jgi:hypothetical protein
MTTHRRWLPATLVLCAYVAFAVLVFSTAWRHPTTRFVGAEFDSSPHAWFLSWVPFALGHGDNPLRSDWIGAPGGVNLTWSTSVTLPGLVMSPVSLLAGPVVAYNLLATLGLTLTAFTAYLLGRRLALSHLAAAIAGAFTGFSPYMLAHTTGGHANLVSVAGVPLLGLLLHDLLVRRHRPPLLLGVLLGLLAAAQLYTAEEVLATEAVVAALGIVVLAAVAGREQVRQHWREATRRLATALGLALPVFAVFAFPLISTQFFSGAHAVGPIWPPGTYVTDLANLLVPSGVEEVAPSAALQLSEKFTGSIAEWGGYVGVPLLALALVVAGWRWRSALVRWAAAMAVLTGVLSLGPRLHLNGHSTWIVLPWRLLGNLPVLEHVLPARLTLYMFIALGLLAGVFVDAVRQQRRAAVRAVGGALLVLCAVTQCPRIPFPTRATETPAFFTGDAVKALPEGAVALLEPGVRHNAMLWQAQAHWRFRMVGGWYFVPDAKGHMGYGPDPTPLSDAVAKLEQGDTTPPTADQLRRYRDELRRDKVRSIVVLPEQPNRAAVVEFFRNLTQADPREDGQGTTYWVGLS